MVQGRLMRALAVSSLAIFAASCASSPETYREFSTPTRAPSSGQPVISQQQALASPDTLITSRTDHQKVGNPYVVAGRRYVPYRNDQYDEVGIGSWYGPNFHGRPTANGETFNQWDMTAAHTTLPIPSIAEVTNLENGRQIIVRINDRGPFVDDRLIDLSRAAAEALDYQSRGLARVRVRYLGAAHPNAAAPARGAGQVDVAAMAPPPPTQAQPQPQTLAAMPAAEPVMMPAVSAATPPATLPESVTLQVAAFSEPSNAQRFAERLSGAGEVRVEPGQSNGRPVYRVYLGRWSDRAAADAARRDLGQWGIYDARIVAAD